MSNPLLPMHISGLTLSKSERTLLDQLALTIHASGITAILGPNGAGKSLLLRCIHGLIKPDHGSIQLGQMGINESRTLQSMVFQHPVLLRRTVIQNLQFAAPTCPQDLLLEALDSVNLLDRLDSPARMLSGGEQQRLALARALLNDPQLLLLDEATASLDPASVHLIESLVLKVRARGTKVILVSHDQGQARRLADEVVFMARGQVLEHTPADVFFESPQTAQAKAYLAGELFL